MPHQHRMRGSDQEQEESASQEKAVEHQPLCLRTGHQDREADAEQQREECVELALDQPHLEEVHGAVGAGGREGCLGRFRQIAIQRIQIGVRRDDSEKGDAPEHIKELVALRSSDRSHLVDHLRSLAVEYPALRLMPPNKKKMSDGGRGRASLGVEGWKSSQKWRAQRSAVRSIAWLDRWRGGLTERTNNVRMEQNEQKEDRWTQDAKRLPEEDQSSPDEELRLKLTEAGDGAGDGEICVHDTECNRETRKANQCATRPLSRTCTPRSRCRAKQRSRRRRRARRKREPCRAPSYRRPTPTP